MNRYKFLSYINRFKDAIAIAVLLFVCYCLYCLPSAYNGLITNIPAVITSAYGVLLMYFLGRKISSKKYGLISALILASVFEYIYISSCCAADMLFSYYDISRNSGFRRSLPRCMVECINFPW